jgi:hypothetical protein
MLKTEAMLGLPGRHGALTENTMAGLASLPPTVQISLHGPKSLFSNCPLVDHRPVSLVEPIMGPQSVRFCRVVLTLIGWLGAAVIEISKRSPI